MSDKEGEINENGSLSSSPHSRVPSHSRSPSAPVSREPSREPSRGSRARSRPTRSPSPRRMYRSRSRSRGRRYTRSRSRSYGRYRERRYRSRSRSYSPHRGRRSSRYYRSYSRSPDRYEYYSRRHHSPYERRRRSHSRSPMSSRRRHVGNRENPSSSRCIGVFGLSLYTQERDLRDLFGRYGQIDEIQIVYDHQTGRSRGFCFIYFHNIEDAEEAKDKLTGYDLDGHKIRIDYSITQRAHTPTPGIYLGKPSSGSGYRDRYRRSPSYHRSRRYTRSRTRSRSYSPGPRRY